MENKQLPVMIDAETLGRIETIWRKHNFKNRSTFVRSAIFEYLKQFTE